MRKIFFGDFRVLVMEHYREIESTGPEAYSIEWFLLRYMKRIIKTTEDITVYPDRVDGTIRALIRFYVDNIDETSELGERCTRIYEEYRKALRIHQGKGES